MTGVWEVVAFGCLALAVALAGIRWTRVAQREHYLAGSASRFAWRWWACRPANVILGLAGIASAGAAYGLGWPAFVVAAAVGAGPVGLGLRGRSAKLAWTRRCVVLAVTTAAICVAVVAGITLGAGARPGLVAACVICVALPAVEDLALALLAPIEDMIAGRYVAQARRRLVSVAPTVVAITGSYGKTTTKGYLAHLLSGRFSVLPSPKSFNNRAGLARTVNEHLNLGTEVLVAEMGTYGPGEIRALCSWLAPRVAVLTAVGPVHLERFGRLEAILEAKAEITEGAEVVVCNVDDQRLAGLADRLEREGRRVVRCSGGGPGGTVADVLVRQADSNLGPTGQHQQVEVWVSGQLIGTSNLSGSVPAGTHANVACALGAALALGCEPAELLERLTGLPGTANRLEAGLSEGGVIVLDDTFNSNPAGAEVALAMLAERGVAARRRVVVTPGMVEMGRAQRAENAAFAQMAAVRATEVVIVGRTNRQALLAGVAEARRVNPEGAAEAVVVGDRSEAVAWVRAQLGRGDVVLYENDLPDHYP